MKKLTKKYYILVLIFSLLNGILLSCLITANDNTLQEIHTEWISKNAPEFAKALDRLGSPIVESEKTLFNYFVDIENTVKGVIIFLIFYIAYSFLCGCKIIIRIMTSHFVAGVALLFWLFITLALSIPGEIEREINQIIFDAMFTILVLSVFLSLYMLASNIEININHKIIGK